MNHNTVRTDGAEEKISPEFRRIRSGAVLGGVCNGISKYVGIDVTPVRAVFVALACLHVIPVVVYLTVIFIVPSDAAEVGDASTIPSLVEQARQSAVEVLRATVSFDRKRLQRCWDEQIAKFRGMWAG